MKGTDITPSESINYTIYLSYVDANRLMRMCDDIGATPTAYIKSAVLSSLNSFDFERLRSRLPDNDIKPIGHDMYDEEEALIKAMTAEAIKIIMEDY